MCHNALLRDEFYEFLLHIDEDLAAETQADGCRRCGSALHKNRYQRKPRGGGLIGLGKGPHFHFSLSCSRCEKRHNPRSVRFLGRRVYLAAIVVLASALRSGLTDRRAKQLTEWLRVHRRCSCTQDNHLPITVGLQVHDMEPASRRTDRVDPGSRSLWTAACQAQ